MKAPAVETSAAATMDESGCPPWVQRLALRGIERRLPGALLLHHVRALLFDELTRSAGMRKHCV